MNPSFRIEQVNNLLTYYRDAVHRPAMTDLAIWQSLEPIYQNPNEYDVVVTSTREEAFDRMVADSWYINMGEHFFGLDYEVIDELVLEYLKDNALVTEVEEDEDE